MLQGGIYSPGSVAIMLWHEYSQCDVCDAGKAFREALSAFSLSDGICSI